MLLKHRINQVSMGVKFLRSLTVGRYTPCRFYAKIVSGWNKGKK